MKRFNIGVAVCLMAILAAVCLSAQTKPAATQKKAADLVCVGLYSETSDGYVSYRVGTGNWTVVKVGDKISPDGEIKINVDRDWVELTPADNPNSVFEVVGPQSGEKITKVADILKGKAKTVNFPKVTGGKADSKYADRLVVTEYLGRQIYIDTDGNRKDIKYGDILPRNGKVQIIAINNTITLMNASGQITKVVGPLKFDVAQVLDNKQLYKFLNVLK